MEYEKSLLLEQQAAERAEALSQASATSGAAASAFTFTQTGDNEGQGDDSSLGGPGVLGATPKRRPGPIGKSSIDAMGYDPLKGSVSSKSKGYRYDPFGVGRGPLAGSDWGRHLAEKDAEAERSRRDGWEGAGEGEEREGREGGGEAGQGSGGANPSQETK
jgi:hypothetical protein